MTSARGGAASARTGTGTVLGDVLRTLAFGGAAAGPDALHAVVEARPSLRSLTIRSTAGDVIARARADEASYDVTPHARRPLDDDWVLDVPLRRGSEAVGILTAVSTRPFTAELAELLADVGSAFALVGACVPAAAAQAVLDVEADLASFAAELDETVGEALVALRHTDAEQVPAAATAALRSLRRIRAELRATSLQEGMRAALGQLRSYGAVVDADDPALDHVGPAAGVLVERVAELACRSALGTPQISVFLEGKAVKLRVLSADNAVDASELARWRRRAGALHGELRHWPGGVELTLPTHP